MRRPIEGHPRRFKTSHHGSDRKFGAVVPICSRQHEEGLLLMTYRNAWASARPSGRTLGAIAKTAITTAAKSTVLAVAFAVASGSLALAQAPKKPPAKKPAPAQAEPAQQAAPAQQQPQQQQQPVQLIYSPWTKFCLPGNETGGKKVCFTGKDARIESGMLVASAVLIEPEGEPKKVFRVTVPLGMALANGTRVLVDQNQPLTAPFSFCVPAGCMADYEITPETIANLKKGKGLYIQAIKVDGQPLTVPLPLGDFAKAYDGPPTDPKVFKDEQDKLQQELQKRAEEARKKLEQANPPPAPGPGAAAAPQGKTQ
jgi:invasion protein IalB